MANTLRRYRELLDNWQLWHERALLDIRRGSPDTAPRPQVFIKLPVLPSLNSNYRCSRDVISVTSHCLWA